MWLNYNTTLFNTKYTFPDINYLTGANFVPCKYIIVDLATPEEGVNTKNGEFWPSLNRLGACYH